VKTDPTTVINPIPDKSMDSFEGGFIHTVKPTNALLLQLHFFHKTCHNSDMVRSILVIRRELLNIKKAYTRTMMMTYTEVKVKIKQSRYRPAVAQRVPGS